MKILKNEIVIQSNKDMETNKIERVCKYVSYRG